MRAREKLFVGLSSAMLATGLIAQFQPPSSDPAERQRQEQQKAVDQLSETQEQRRERLSREAELHGDAERARQRTPGEHRPRMPLPGRLP